MNEYRTISKLAKYSHLWIVILLSSTCLRAEVHDTVLTVYIGQSDVLDFEQPVKRVAIANPEVADATVISPSQILVVGKTIGTTSMIVWSEGDDYIKYKLNIQKESSSRQVMLQVRFMEVNRTALSAFGMDFILKEVGAGKPTSFDVGSFGGRVGEPSDPLTLGNAVNFFFQMPTQKFTAIFKALQENNMLSLLATPNLSAISGAEASFLAGGEFPIPIVSGSMGMQTVTIHYKEFGVKLKFVPTVLDSNIVNIQVDAEVSSLNFESGVSLSGFSVPSLISRKAETTVELAEGRYLIIGGLLSNDMAKTVAKIPVLGHIPILGRLFSSRRFQNNESELLIALSPQIVHSITQEEIPEMNLDDEKK